jgi:hypothetical protein
VLTYDHFLEMQHRRPLGRYVDLENSLEEPVRGLFLSTHVSELMLILAPKVFLCPCLLSADETRLPGRPRKVIEYN